MLKRVYAKRVALTVEEAICEGLLRRGAKRVCRIAFKNHSEEGQVWRRALKEGSEGGSARKRVFEEGMRPLLRSWSEENGKRGIAEGGSQV